MANTLDPRHFYRVTRVLLVPTLVSEMFGRVAAEALANGIPVLASDRGALPEGGERNIPRTFQNGTSNTAQVRSPDFSRRAGAARRFESANEP